MGAAEYNELSHLADNSAAIKAVVIKTRRSEDAGQNEERDVEACADLGPPVRTGLTHGSPLGVRENSHFQQGL